MKPKIGDIRSSSVFRIFAVLSGLLTWFSVFVSFLEMLVCCSVEENSLDGSDKCFKSFRALKKLLRNVVKERSWETNDSK